MNRSDPRARCRSGLTLIEIVIVLTILGMIAALLFPVVVAARERHNIAICAGNLRQIYRVLRLYQADWDDQLPPRNPTNYASIDPHKPSPWHEYGLKPDQLRCPSSPERTFLTTDYGFRLGLDFWQEGEAPAQQRETSIDLIYSRTVEPTSEWVIAFCARHLLRGTTWPPETITGRYLALRINGKVESLSAKQVVCWGRKYGKWYPPTREPGRDLPLGTVLYPAFPKEVWPPRFKPGTMEAW